MTFYFMFSHHFCKSVFPRASSSRDSIPLSPGTWPVAVLVSPLFRREWLSFRLSCSGSLPAQEPPTVVLQHLQRLLNLAGGPRIYDFSLHSLCIVLPFGDLQALWGRKSEGAKRFRAGCEFISGHSLVMPFVFDFWFS